MFKDMKDELEKRTWTEVVEEDVPVPENTKVEQCDEYKILVENIPLLMSHVEVVVNRAEFFHIRFGFMHLGTTISGTTYLPLGIILGLWENYNWIGKCRDCGSKVYITSAGGSGLSGSHHYSGFCTTCVKHFYGHFSSFGELRGPVHSIKNNFSNRRKILKTHGKFHSWKYGLIGEDVPDVVVDEGVVPAEISELISYLKTL